MWKYDFFLSNFIRTTSKSTHYAEMLMYFIRSFRFFYKSTRISWTSRQIHKVMLKYHTVGMNQVYSGVHLCSLHLKVYLPNSCVTAHWCVCALKIACLLFLLVAFIRADTRCCSAANTIMTEYWLWDDEFWHFVARWRNNCSFCRDHKTTCLPCYSSKIVKK